MQSDADSDREENGSDPNIFLETARDMMVLKTTYGRRRRSRPVYDVRTTRLCCMLLSFIIHRW
jgi:hypothetical protein